MSMIDNPGSTLVRPVAVELCYAAHPQDPEVICTRVNDHKGHCCDSIARKAWHRREYQVICEKYDYNHAAELPAPGQPEHDVLDDAPATPDITVRPPRPAIDLCLERHPSPKKRRLLRVVCTRIEYHKGHHCDETAGISWYGNRRPMIYVCNYDHSKEKGLVNA
jgi:hypothetical protein